VQKTCKNCSAGFEITEADLKFYDSVSPEFAGKKYPVPPPTHCPECRMQRMYATHNIRNLYTRNCSGTGKKIISIYSPDKATPVYEYGYWWSDNWDPMNFGRDVDFSRPVFDQINELFKAVPSMSLINDGMENSDYANYCGWGKNCYLCFCTDHSEDCMYCQDLLRSKDCMDCLHSYDLQLCYDCLDCSNSYSLRHSQNCTDCSDSSYLFDCTGCKYCYGCTGLRQKEYYVLNQKLTKQEYQERIKEIQSDPEGFQKQYQELLISHPRKMIGHRNIDSTGNYLFGCKKADHCFDCYDLEDSKYCYSMKGGGKNCYDVMRWGNPAELCIESCGIGEGVLNVGWTLYSWNGCSNLYYCMLCISCKDCFACNGLRHKQYCIFNKQYSKDEYEKKVAEIIEYMQSTGEWGEFFPIQLSLFGYNETPAQDFFPLTKEEALAKGYSWKNEDDHLPDVEKIIPGAKLPPDIKSIPDDVLNWAIECEETKKPFKIAKAELKYYREHEFPIPHFHPDVRNRKRLENRNPRKLWERNCVKCSKKIHSTYSSDRSEIVYCEECYLSEVY